MQTTTALKKIQQLESRLLLVEQKLTGEWIGDSRRGLRMLSGIWQKQPRKKHDLDRARKKLWSNS